MLRRLALGTLLVACPAHPSTPPGSAAPAPEQKPALVLKSTLTADAPSKARLFLFEGKFPGPVHRSGPEHFKLERISDGERVSLDLAYDREELDERDSRKEVVKKVRPARGVLLYNHLFKGVRLSLDTGPVDAKDRPADANLLDLHGRAKLEPGTRYRMTWACWPVGAKEAAEVTCDFEMSK
jgi:hypothetical protein